MVSSSNPVIHSLVDAPIVIYAHMAVALSAVIVGLFVLVRRKGTISHKVLGRLWVGLMLTAAISSFAIQARGRLSLIHGFAILVLLMAPLGWYFARSRNIRGHRITMTVMFVSLCITGLFTLLPYRMLGQAVFATEVQPSVPHADAMQGASSDKMAEQVPP